MEPTEYKTTVTETMPMEIFGSIIYLERRNGFNKWAYFKCPKCDELIQIPTGGGKNSWSVDVDFWGRPTLSPSIWQTGSCQAHFFIRKGKIDWCS